MTSGPPTSAGHAIVTTAVDSEESAAALARSAVEARLAACAQVEGPVVSTYRWGGAVETAREWRVVFKTTAAAAPELVAHVAVEHPYEVPEVLTTPVVGGHGPYLAWLDAETRRESHLRTPRS